MKPSIAGVCGAPRLARQDDGPAADGTSTAMAPAGSATLRSAAMAGCLNALGVFAAPRCFARYRQTGYAQPPDRRHRVTFTWSFVPGFNPRTLAAHSA